MSNSANENIPPSETNTERLVQYLTFSASGQHYGILSSDVVEISKISSITEMPELPNYVKGIIIMRGHVIPLIDINLRFGKPEQEYTDRTCIVIVNINEIHLGIIVDDVDEVLDIENSCISSPPILVGDDACRYITGIAKVESHTVFLIDCHLLFSDADTALLNQSLNN